MKFIFVKFVFQWCVVEEIEGFNEANKQSQALSMYSTVFYNTSKDCPMVDCVFLFIGEPFSAQ